MPRVSIVIPVYNMQQFLDRCMESVLSQTLEDIEIILVDDGSSDASPGLCDEYAARDSRIVVIHKENGGLTSAWKEGSKAATGEYIGYVDSDDFIQKDMFEVMYQRGVKTGADIVCCGYTHVYESDPNRKWTEHMLYEKDTMTREDLEREIFPKLINDGSFFGRTLMPNRVTKLVKRELVQKNLPLCQDEVSIGEDYQFTLCMFLDADRIEIVRDFYPYFYYMNDASMTMKHDKNYMKKIDIMRENLCRISDAKNGFDLKPQIWDDYLCLTVLHVKAVIYKQKNLPYGEIRKELQQVLNHPPVAFAMNQNRMNRLHISEKIFLFLMKHKLYFMLYVLIRLYFK